jgi:hypothetical protein
MYTRVNVVYDGSAETTAISKTYKYQYSLFLEGQITQTFDLFDQVFT